MTLSFLRHESNEALVDVGGGTGDRQPPPVSVRIFTFFPVFFLHFFTLLQSVSLTVGDLKPSPKPPKNAQNFDFGRYISSEPNRRIRRGEMTSGHHLAASVRSETRV